MPAGFEKCEKAGGRIRRITGPSKHFGLKGGEYLNICFLNNEMYRGEVHKKEKEKG